MLKGEREGGVKEGDVFEGLPNTHSFTHFYTVTLFTFSPF